MLGPGLVMMLVQLATLAFAVLLLCAHDFGQVQSLTARPLSMFRDGEAGAAGYCLFALLMLINGAMLWGAVRQKYAGEAVVYSLAAVLLAVVAATPSWGGLHNICALLLLLVLYCCFAALLIQEESRWLFAHLIVPVVLLFATRFHSYGLWQKCLIAYFLFAVNIRAHALSQRVPGRRRNQRRPSPGYPLRRRVIYRLSAPSRTGQPARI